MLQEQSLPGNTVRVNGLTGNADGSACRMPGVPSLSEIEQSLMKTFDIQDDSTHEKNFEERLENKLDLGISILQHVEGQLNRADAKAQFTLTLDAIFIASSAFFGADPGNVLMDRNGMVWSRLILFSGAAMFVTLLVSTTYAILAVIPRLTSAKRAGSNVFYFGNIVLHQREHFVAHYLSQSDWEVEKMLISEIYDLAGIAKQKFSLVRISYLFLFIALGFWSIVQILILSA